MSDEPRATSSTYLTLLQYVLLYPAGSVLLDLHFISSFLAPPDYCYWALPLPLSIWCAHSTLTLHFCGPPSSHGCYLPQIQYSPHARQACCRSSSPSRQIICDSQARSEEPPPPVEIMLHSTEVWPHLTHRGRFVSAYCEHSRIMATRVAVLTILSIVLSSPSCLQIQHACMASRVRIDFTAPVQT